MYSHAKCILPPSSEKWRRSVILDISLRENTCSSQEIPFRGNGGLGKDLLSWCCIWQSFTLYVTTLSTFLCFMYMPKTPFISSGTTKSRQDFSGNSKENIGKAVLAICINLEKRTFFPWVSHIQKSFLFSCEDMPNDKSKWFQTQAEILSGYFKLLERSK